MFLSSNDDSQHELDFRFEVFPKTDEFLFVHHGINLSELADEIDLSRFGSVFYMTDLEFPLTIEDVLADSNVWRQNYGTDPVVAYGRYVQFDLERLAQFFRNTRLDTGLDCTIVGAYANELSEEELRRFTEAITKDYRTPISALWKGSWLHVHDNHFLWLMAQSIEFLRVLIDESIVGFFHQVHPHTYDPLPRALIDLVLQKYHTAPLVCFPEGRQTGLQSNKTEVTALMETRESHWTAYRADLSADLLGRSLLVSYNLQDNRWSWQEK